MQSCCSPVASTSAAASRLCPLQLLLHDCVLPCDIHASDSAIYCSQIVSSSTTAWPRSCPLPLLLPIASASAAAPRSHLLQLPHCAQIASASTPVLCPLQLVTALRLCPFAAPAILEDSSPCPTFSIDHSLRSWKFGGCSEGRASSV